MSATTKTSLLRNRKQQDVKSTADNVVMKHTQSRTFKTESVDNCKYALLGL